MLASVTCHPLIDWIDFFTGSSQIILAGILDIANYACVYSGCCYPLGNVIVIFVCLF